MNRLTETAVPRGPEWTAARPSDLDRRFQSAARHSVRVRLLRVAVPVLAGLVCTGLALAAWFNPLRNFNLPNVTGTLGISGTKITMQLPRLAGFTRDDRAYELSARTADQDLTRPDNVELKGIDAKMQMQDRSTVEMTAATGLYNTKAQQVTLGEDVRLKTSTGYEARLSHAVIDIRSGHIVSEQPVEVKLLNGVLNAKAIEVVGSGDLVRFDGGVMLVLNPSSPGPGAKQGAPPP
jgi:lipopolysaccharide export system protein LptC